MTNKATVIQYLKDYLVHFPDEANRCRIFSDYLDRNTDETLYSRKNFDGHITTSAFIIDRATGEILLLKHRSLNRWLQPGGHVEQDVTLLNSALREAEEETGIDAAQLKHIAIVPGSDIPFDIDSHYIPENPKKQEAGHYHHDLRYLFLYQGNGTIQFNPDESTGLKWVAFNDLKDDATFGAMIDKIKAAL